MKFCSDHILINMLLLFLLSSQLIIAKAEYVKDDPTSVINGELANIEDYPFYVYLRYKNYNSLLCGGALIRPNIVLTAAHCLGIYNFTVHPGITSVEDLKETKAYEVDDYVIHPLYDTDDNDTVYDIGLVRLTEDVVYGSKIQPIDLADTKPPVDEQVTVIGFGKVTCDIFMKIFTDQCLNPSSTHLRKATMNITSTDDSKIQSVGVNQNVCYGDSGGPMIYDDKIVGVASTVDFDNCEGGNTYTPVDEYLLWIQEYIDRYFR